MDKFKQTLNAYNIMFKEKTLGTFENKEKTCGDYVCIYECSENYALQPLNACEQHKKRPPVR